ncbi:hypothetical protein J3D46_004898 [Paenarthrobacter sp. A20]|nr:hypothetical protein [Paenarthrobacter sp. A20]
MIWTTGTCGQRGRCPARKNRKQKRSTEYRGGNEQPSPRRPPTRKSRDRRARLDLFAHVGAVALRILLCRLPNPEPQAWKDAQADHAQGVADERDTHGGSGHCSAANTNGQFHTFVALNYGGSGDAMSISPASPTQVTRPTRSGAGPGRPWASPVEVDPFHKASATNPRHPFDSRNTDRRPNCTF